MSSNPQCNGSSVHWLKVERLLGSVLSTVVTPTWSHDHVSLSGCVTLTVGMSWTYSLAWQTHLPDATADRTSLLNQDHVQYQNSTEGSTAEKPAETQTSIQLASHLFKRLTPDLEDMSLNPQCGGNLMHWLKVERLLGSGLSTIS
jgi:hypothetical protein